MGTDFGARFVDIAGWPADSEPTSDSMTCYFVHSALLQQSAVRVSSLDDTAQVLNGIHDITMRSALSNFMSTPTDCPSRCARWHNRCHMTFSLASLTA